MANYFTDRAVQYPGRVKLIPTGNENEYDLTRAEGTVTTPGTPFNASTFNDIAEDVIDDTISMLGDMKTLWSGVMLMDASQTATLSEKVSEQLTGIVLVWSYYTNNEAQNYGYHPFFVPKMMVKLKNGVGYDIPLRRDKNAMFGTKYVYVYDDRLVGYATNVATGTANNVPYQNNKWVLRYVFGC